MSEKQERWQERARKAGKCPHCGGTPMVGKVLCERRLEWERVRRAAKRVLRGAVAVLLLCASASPRPARTWTLVLENRSERVVDWYSWAGDYWDYHLTLWPGERYTEGGMTRGQGYLIGVDMGGDMSVDRERRVGARRSRWVVR
jgi:hypothetical protein